MIVEDVTFINDTDAPTVLVSGGSLVVRGSTITETTGGSRAAVEVAGGRVDLGTADEPGGNTLTTDGAGWLIANTGGEDVTAIGNTFQADGAAAGVPLSHR